MRILFVGAFNVPWSADFPRARGLIQNENKVFCFNYRYKIKNESQIKFSENLKPQNIKLLIKNIVRSKLNNSYLKKILTYFKSKNFHFYQKILEIKKYYLKGNWEITRRLLYEVKRNQYDLVFLCKIDTLNYQIIPKLNKYTKTWYFIMDPLSTVLEINADKYAVLSTFSSGTFSSVNTFFKKKGANSFHIIEGYDSKIFKPKNKNEKTIDVIFAGAKSNKRERFIELLKNNNIKVICYGNGWENDSIYIEELVDKYRETKVILNFTRGNIGFSDRVLYAMGTGSFLLSEYCKDLEKIFKKGIHLDWFKSENELLSLVNYYLENDAIRERITLQGNKFVHENFTWEKIMEKIIKIIKNNL